MKIALLVILVIGAWWGLQSLERRSLYIPDRTLIAKPAIYRLAYEDVQVTSHGGARVYGWFIAGKTPITILLSHGNAGNISHRLDKAVRLHQTGASLLLFDYQGYGQSEGKPTEQGTYQDAEAMYEYLIKAKQVKPGNIVFYGESLGCAVSTEMALRHPGAGLILECPFTSTVAMAKRIFPWLPARWIIRYRYDNLAKMPKLKVPLLIMHSPEDEIIPFQMAQDLYAAAPNPKTFFKLTGDHNNGYEITGDRYIQAVDDFLKSVRSTT